MSAYLLKINWVDIVILILLLRTCYVGFTRGLSYELLTVFGVIVALVFAIHNYKYVGQFFHNRLKFPIEFSDFISFIVILGAVYFILRVLRNICCNLIKIELFGPLERFGGLLFGFMRGCLVASLLLLCFLFIPNQYVRSSVYSNSLAGLAFLNVAPTCYQAIVSIVPRFRDADRVKIIEDILRLKPDKQKSGLKRRQLKYW